MTENREQNEAWLVMGMHRSGTSVVAGCLRALGYYLGGSIMQAKEGVNDSGFYESIPVQLLNEEILRLEDRSWSTIPPINRGFEDKPEMAEATGRIVNLLRRDFLGQKRFALKDPRMCRLLPVWSKAFAQCEVTPRLLFVLRNPLEVALSLQRRDNFPFGHSLLLWHYHFVEAFRESHGLYRAWISYRTLLDQPVETLGRILPQTEGEGVADLAQNSRLITEFVSPSLNHAAAPAVEELVAQCAEAADFAQAWGKLEKKIIVGGVAETDVASYEKSVAVAVRRLLEQELFRHESADERRSRAIDLEVLKRKGTSPFFYFSAHLEAQEKNCSGVDRQLLVPEVPNDFVLTLTSPVRDESRILKLHPLQVPGVVTIERLHLELTSSVRATPAIQIELDERPLTHEGCVIFPKSEAGPLLVVVESEKNEIAIALPVGSWDSLKLSIVATPTPFPQGSSSWLRDVFRLQEANRRLRLLAIKLGMAEPAQPDVEAILATLEQSPSWVETERVQAESTETTVSADAWNQIRTALDGIGKDLLEHEAKLATELRSTRDALADAIRQQVQGMHAISAKGDQTLLASVEGALTERLEQIERWLTQRAEASDGDFRLVHDALVRESERQTAAMRESRDTIHQAVHTAIEAALKLQLAEIEHRLTHHAGTPVAELRLLRDELQTFTAQRVERDTAVATRNLLLQQANARLEGDLREAQRRLFEASQRGAALDQLASEIAGVRTGLASRQGLEETCASQHHELAAIRSRVEELGKSREHLQETILQLRLEYERELAWRRRTQDTMLYRLCGFMFPRHKEL